MDIFENISEQAEAKRLLRAAIADEGPAHAYLFHGPPGVGKRATAIAFAGELIGDRGRVERGSHPDVYLIEPVGDQIRIDDIRELRRDLHMRPFEADRRVYLVYAAETMNEDAADALLKDLEEPPPYAVIVLVADDLGPLPETIRSRCQLVPFTRLSERAIREEIDARAPGLDPDRPRRSRDLHQGVSTAPPGCWIPRAPAGARRCSRSRAPSISEPEFEPGEAAQRILDGARECGAEAKRKAEEGLELLDLPTREAEQRVRRAPAAPNGKSCSRRWRSSPRGTATWSSSRSARSARSSTRTGAELLERDGTTERLAGAERACELVRETWRAFEEFNLSPPLALEALFVQLRRELGRHSRPRVATLVLGSSRA